MAIPFPTYPPPTAQGLTMTSTPSDDELLVRAFSAIADAKDTEQAIVKLRELLRVDHIVYYLPKPNAAPYVRLTYPAAWIKRYLEMNYGGIDPIALEGTQRTLPFSWSELKINGPQQAAFVADALSHGIGPHGLSIPLTDYGHRALFSISSSQSDREWKEFLSTTKSTVVKIANRLHQRIVGEIFDINPAP
jgi:LuxR family transcriptional regulator, quorum-sensing system regulator CinR